MYNFIKYDRIETEEEFHETMDKIADYGIEEEDVSIMKKSFIKMSSIFEFQEEETLKQISMLRHTMRDHRLRKKELYIESMAPSQEE